MEKSDEDSADNDSGIHSEQFPNEWVIFADKGYQGAAHHVRVIHPKKKPANGTLSTSDVQFNVRVSSDRIIVEIFFGRMCDLWGVMSHKYRWNEASYDMFFETCLSLTKLHVKFNPLRSEDGAFYDNIKNRLASIGRDQARKRKRTQDQYKERRRIRLSVQFDNFDSSDE